MGASCASSDLRPVAGEALVGTDDATHDLAPRGGDRFAVLIFFSADCHVLRAHDERLLRLAQRYAGRGVRFFAVDSEVGATLLRDRREGQQRGYPFPIVLDEKARVAKAFGAEYAGYAVVLDRAGRVAYRGGIDSDRVRLTEDATPYLSQALADLLAGRPPRVAEAKTLGCALRTW
jgi:thiol-disulfide isomerase/thioredoxin